MNYITGVSSNFYNPEYFNLLEQFEYQVQYDDTVTFIMESYQALLEYESVEYDNTKKAGLLKRLSQKVKGNQQQQLTKGQAFMQRIKEYFVKAIAFLARLAQKFMDKADELFNINKKFIEEKAYLVLGIKDDDFWKKITITMFDYNTVNLQKTPYADFHIPELDANNNDTKKIYSSKWDDEQFEKAYFSKILKFKGDKDSFKDAAKNYYRNIQGSDKKPNVLTGRAAQDRLINCHTYVKNYKQVTAKRIRDAISKIKGSLERVKKDYETNKIIEYATAESFLPLFEVGSNVTTNDQPKNGTVETEAPRGDAAVEEKDKNRVGERIFGRIKKYAQYLQTLHTAQMTVAEEYYFTSIHVLKSVVSIAEKEHKIDAELAKSENTRDKNAEAARANAMKKNSRSDAVNTGGLD